MNESKLYLQYMKETKQYCFIHIFKLLQEMTENEQESIIHDS
jgi:hypothetical protein